MHTVKNIIRIDANLLFRSLLSSFYSALILSAVTTISSIADFHYIAILVFAFYYFVSYVLFATFIQLKLNENPKKYRFNYLIIYMIGAFIATIIVIVGLFRENPFITVNFYLIVILAATVFWIVDSFLLQKLDNN